MQEIKWYQMRHSKNQNATIRLQMFILSIEPLIEPDPKDQAHYCDMIID